MKLISYDKDKIWISVITKWAIFKKIGCQTTSNDKNIGWVPTTLNKVEELIEEYDFVELESLKEELSNEIINRNLNKDLCITKCNNKMLRPYQKIVVDRIKAKGSFGLFMEQRTGKTPTTIIAIKDAKKIIVAVPNGLQESWKQSFKTFDNRESMIVKGTPIKRKKIYKEFFENKEGVLIGSIDTIAKDAIENKINKYFDYLVLDEAHFLRNRTKKTKGILSLRKRAKNALALTGTPATNKAEDVIPVIRFLEPKTYTKWGLIKYYFNVSLGRFALEINGVNAARDVEWAQFLDDKSVSLKQKEVMEWLPEITHYHIDLDMESKQKIAFNKMRKEFKMVDANGKVSREENILTQMMRLRQISLSPKILNLDGNGAKTKWIKGWVKENKKEPVVIWSTSAKYLDILYDELKSFHPLLLYGKTKNSDRQQVVNDFNAGKTNIILANIRVASTGYTINRATTMIFMDRDWSAIENEQANARFLPTEENAAKIARSIINVNCNDSLDSLVKLANDNKLSNTEIVNNFKKWL